MSDYDNYSELTIQQTHLPPLVLKNSGSRIVFIHMNYDYIHELCSLRVKYAR